jgi:hypothetical protein
MAVAAFTSSCDSMCIDWACLLGAAGMHGTWSPAAASRRLKKGNRVGLGRLFLPTEDSTGVVGSLPELLTRQLLKLNQIKGKFRIIIVCLNVNCRTNLFTYKIEQLA